MDGSIITGTNQATVAGYKVASTLAHPYFPYLRRVSIKMSRGIFNLVLVVLVASVYVSDVKARCSRKFSKFAKDHTACSTIDKSVGGKGISRATKAKILKIHNDYRAKQGGSNMLKMFWDDEVAMLAQKHAERCKWGHDENYQRTIPGRFGVGQNIAIGRSNWELALKDWYTEVDNFIYGKGAKNGGKPIGHFTAMVWAESLALGCGFAKCNYKGNVAGYYVCNYGPAGNGRNMAQPYKRGKKGSMCKKKTSDGLCDCGRVECDNGGTLNTKTCKCECKKYAWIQKNNACKLDCSKKITEHPFFCFDKEDCKVFSDMGAQCPKLCNTCP